LSIVGRGGVGAIDLIFAIERAWLFERYAAPATTQDRGQRVGFAVDGDLERWSMAFDLKRNRKSARSRLAERQKGERDQPGDDQPPELPLPQGEREGAPTLRSQPGRRPRRI
jgi:hypothetical protein